MKKNKTKIISILLIILSTISTGTNAYAHSGRTDSSGGHKDNKNQSGLGSYHYHCGGHPAHLHTNGVCPYSSNSSSNKRSTSSSSSKSNDSGSYSSGTKTTAITPSTIDVTAIQINEKFESIEVGKSKILTATITPSNATDKNVTWKSSDESIATVSTSGEVTAEKSGIVNISAISSNGKTSTITINIKESPKVENNDVTNRLIINNSDITKNSTKKDKNNSNPLGGFVALGLLGGGGYLVYKRFKS